MPDPAVRLGADTVRVGILGWPVGHSLSPWLHNDVHRQLGIDAHYHLVPTRPEALSSAVRAAVRLGWRGCNVTIPHKVDALGLCDEVDPAARLIGAVNLLTFESGRVVGANTDAPGWLASLREETDWDPGQPALVFGTGGAARAVVTALGQSAADVTVVGRRGEAVGDLVELARRAGARTSAGVVGMEPMLLARAVRAARLVVNATPLGMHDESLPAPLQDLGEGQIASDLVYEPARTHFLAAAEAAGALVHTGIGMLVHQAARGFARWHGVTAPLAEFAAAARTARSRG